MSANSSYKAMHDIVEQAKKGTIFIPDDFTTCGTPDAVRSGLSRLCRNGKLHIYYIPLYDKWDGTLREPRLDAIALKIAQCDNARVIVILPGIGCHYPCVIQLEHGKIKRFDFQSPDNAAFYKMKQLLD